MNFAVYFIHLSSNLRIFPEWKQHNYVTIVGETIVIHALNSYMVYCKSLVLMGDSLEDMIYRC